MSLFQYFGSSATFYPNQVISSIIALTTGIFPEAATRGVLYQKLFLEISQNSQENTFAKVSFLIRLQAGLQLYWKWDSGTGVFLWILRNFSELLFYRTPLIDCFSFLVEWQSQKNIFNGFNYSFCFYVSYLVKANKIPMTLISNQFTWNQFQILRCLQSPLPHLIWCNRCSGKKGCAKMKSFPGATSFELLHYVILFSKMEYIILQTYMLE